MKKCFLGFAALSLLFIASSCSEETSESAADRNGQVSFKTALGKQTKASEFTNTSWQASDQLTVHSYTLGTTTELNQFSLVYDGTSSWSYSPLFNQPGVSVRYYTVYPETNVSAAGPTAASYVFNYMVQGVDTQEDLIGAAVTTIDDDVTLTFSHLLSQVNFAVMDVLGVEIEIDNISVNGVKNQGTYLFGAATPWGYLPAGTPSVANYAYTPTTDPFTTTGLAAGIRYMGNGGTTYPDDYLNDNALMLMPQTFAAEADGAFTFDFTLTILDGDAIDDNEETKTGTAIKANFCDFDTFTWAPGKRYVYVIDFSTYLTGGPINFTVQVDSWVNDDDNTLVETVLVAEPDVYSVEAAIEKHSDYNGVNYLLKVFPITVNGDITISTPIEITSWPIFNAGDQIRIEFPSASSTSFITTTVAGWSKSVSGRVATFTCNIAGTEFIFTSNLQISEVQAAIGFHNDQKADDPTLTVFPTESPVDISSDMTIMTIDGSNFVQGDQLQISFPSASSVSHLLLDSSFSGTWTRTESGNKVILTRD